MTKISNTEIFNWLLSSKGKLVFIYTDEWAHLVAHKGREIHRTEFYGSAYLDLGDKYIKQIVVSETEDIEVGDMYYNPGWRADLAGIINSKVIETCEYEHEAKACLNHPRCYKILALPEHFSPKHLQAIVDGKLKDGDTIYLKANKATCSDDLSGKDWEDYYKLYEKHNKRWTDENEDNLFAWSINEGKEYLPSFVFKDSVDKYICIIPSPSEPQKTFTDAQVKTFTDAQVKALMLETFGKMMPKQRDLSDFNGTEILQAVEFGMMKQAQMERMVYLRGISDLDETISNYKKTNNI